MIQTRAINTMAAITGQVVKSVGKAMFTRNSYSILRHAQCSTIMKSLKYSTNTQEAESERDPAPLFFNKEVQNLLNILIRPDPKIVFRTQRIGNRIQDPKYEFMTDQQLQDAQIAAEKRGAMRLQMPPVVKKRKEIDSVLSKDPALQGHDTSKYVFTDITYGLNQYERLIVIREPNGILRHAQWAERQRINQTYFPLKGRDIVPPKMFQEEYLKDLLSRQEYEYILNRACLQYDPNDPEYHRITETVYTAVNNEKHYNYLRSTRHYGPLAFYLAWTKNIDNLLLENITTNRLEDAALIIKLYNMINPTAKSAEMEYDNDHIKYIENYINLESLIRGKLEMALNALKELLKARETVEDGIKKAHGL